MECKAALNLSDLYNTKNWPYAGDGRVDGCCGRPGLETGGTTLSPAPRGMVFWVFFGLGSPRMAFPEKSKGGPRTPKNTVFGQKWSKNAKKCEKTQKNPENPRFFDVFWSFLAQDRLWRVFWGGSNQARV